MKSIIYSEIRPSKIRALKIDKKRKKLGILHAGIFFDLTKEVQNIKKEEMERIRQIIKQELTKRGEKITDTPTGEVTHLIISVRDIEKLNFRGKHDRKRKTN